MNETLWNYTGHILVHIMVAIIKGEGGDEYYFQNKGLDVVGFPKWRKSICREEQSEMLKVPYFVAL